MGVPGLVGWPPVEGGEGAEEEILAGAQGVGADAAGRVGEDAPHAANLRQVVEQLLDQGHLGMLLLMLTSLYRIFYRPSVAGAVL